MADADFDLQAAHRYFSSNCFNLTWELLGKAERTAEENDVMLQRSLSSLWHWTQRTDCTPTNLSIGYWQVSRVYSVIGQPDNARHYGELCLACSQCAGVEPVYIGFGYEALARAEMVAGNRSKMAEYLELAHRQAEAVVDPDDIQVLLSDLGTIH